MRRTIAIFAGMALLLAVAVPVSAAARPVTVDGRGGWVGTGIQVDGGDVLTVTTLGFVTTAKIPEWFIPGEFISGSGPAGQVAGQLCGDVEPFVINFTGPCAVDDAYFGELVARVGGSAFDESTFIVGNTASIVVPAGLSGELELAVNDFEFTYGDNTGAFTVIFR